MANCIDNDCSAALLSFEAPSRLFFSGSELFFRNYNNRYCKKEYIFLRKAREVGHNLKACIGIGFLISQNDVLLPTSATFLLEERQTIVLQ